MLKGQTLIDVYVFNVNSYNTLSALKCSEWKLSVA